MKKKIISLTSLFILFVIVMAPATLIEQMLPSHPKVSLSQFSGNFWSGNIASAQVVNKQFENVAYSINPLALFMAKLSLNLTIPRGDISGDFNLILTSEAPKKVAINNINMRIRAPSLEPLLPIGNVDLAGMFSAQNLDIRLENNKPQFVRGEVAWRQAAVTFAGAEWLLGDFIIDATTDEKTNVISGKLQKSNNKLDLQGQFTLSPNGVFEFVGSVAQAIDKTLYQTVALFNDGKPANGRLPIKFKQKIL